MEIVLISKKQITSVDWNGLVLRTICDLTNITTDNNARFFGKNFTVTDAFVLAEISSDITLEMLDSITLEASGSSSINLYGNPKIIVNKLTDTSKIQKKIK